MDLASMVRLLLSRMGVGLTSESLGLEYHDNLVSWFYIKFILSL